MAMGKKLEVRLSEEQHARFQEAAARSKVSLSEFIRGSVARMADHVLNQTAPTNTATPAKDQLVSTTKAVQKVVENVQQHPSHDGTPEGIAYVRGVRVNLFRDRQGRLFYVRGGAKRYFEEVDS